MASNGAGVTDLLDGVSLIALIRLLTGALGSLDHVFLSWRMKK